LLLFIAADIFMFRRSRDLARSQLPTLASPSPSASLLLLLSLSTARQTAPSRCVYWPPTAAGAGAAAATPEQLTI